MRPENLSNLIILLFTAAFASAATRLVPDQYPNIQAAIDDCNDGDVVIVSQGRYYESLWLNGIDITLTSANPEDSNIVAATVIDANGLGRVIRFAGTETPDFLLTGFTITGGVAKDAGGIAGTGSTATISYCVITGNTATKNGAGLYHCHGEIRNCQITNNRASEYGSGIHNCDGSITNCIVVGNSNNDPLGAAMWHCDGPITNCVVANNRRRGLSWCDNLILNCTVVNNGKYGLERCAGQIINCIVWANETGQLYLCSPAISSYAQDPHFVDPNNGNYRLRTDSPCIDAGTNPWPIIMPETDLDGNFRQIDGDGDGRVTPDIGTYELGVVDTSLISAQPERFEFIAIQDANTPPSQQLNIANIGLYSIDWEIIEDCTWLNAFPTSGNSEGEIDQVVLTVSHSGMMPGRYVYDLAVTDSTSSNSPLTVLVILIIRAEFLSIQAAVDVASNGDMITVEDGIYTGLGNYNIDFLGKSITLKSDSGPENCIIDCNDLGGGFYFHSGEDTNSIVDGFTIINGNAGYAGGIYIYQSSPTIRNCVVKDNFADYVGGIYIRESSAVIDGCFVSNNNQKYTWYTASIISVGGSAVIKNTSITGNLTTGCGGIYLSDSTTVKDCIISNNNGIGIKMVCVEYPSIENCIITRNSSGGIYMRGADSRCGTLSPKITNCTIVGNPYGIYWTDGEYRSYLTDPIVTNCIVCDNLHNQIIDFDDTLSISYSNIQFGWPGIGNIDVDPLFVSPGYWDTNDTPEDFNDDRWVDGDYHLKSQGWRWDTERKMWTWDDITSRCIDAGDPGSPLGDEPLSIPADPNNDWGVNVRINMGAYGGTAEASIPPHGWTIRTDYNNDGIVNFTDFACWSIYHGYILPEPPDNSSPSPTLNAGDLALFADRWLDQTTWFTTPSPASSLPPNAASNPDPFDGATGIRTYPVLSWQPGFGAISHNIYFGTAYPPPFQANRTETTFDPGSLSYETTYFWRIDEVNADGTTPGPVWSFTTTQGGGR